MPLGILMGLSLLLHGAVGTANVSSQQDFRAALLDSSVTDILLTDDVTLTPVYWDSFLPVIINRNVTIRGPNVSLAEMTRVLNLGYVKGKATLLPGVGLMIEYVVLSGAQAQASRFEMLAFRQASASPNLQALANVSCCRMPKISGVLKLPLLSQ